VNPTAQTENDSAFKKHVLKLGCKYALTANMFITSAEFHSSEINYNPDERWGEHLKEGNFRKLLDWLSEEDHDLLFDKKVLFVRFVSVIDGPCEEIAEVQVPFN
jgi:hypothetical protein